MSNQLTDPALDYPAGTTFDFDVWTADTSLTLVNVNWDNMYKDVVRFQDRAALNAWIDSQATTESRITKANRVKITGTIKIDIPFNAARRYNYIRASNPVQPVRGDVQKDYYYFILDSREAAPQTTELIVQLDVYQTYIYDVRFGNVFLERGHMGVANSKRFDSFGRDYLTIPEGLDVGSDYRTLMTRNVVPMQPQSYNIMAASTINLTADPGDKTNPDIVMARGGRIQGVASAVTYYVWENFSRWQSFLTKFKDAPWVTQGITHISVVPNLLNWISGWTWDDYDTDYMGKEMPPNYIPPRTTQMFDSAGWRNRDEIESQIPARYRHVKDKFKTFPYMQIMVTSFSGDALVLKPELWNNARGAISQRINFVPPNQRIQCGPQGYNSPNGYTVSEDDAGMYPLEDGGDSWNTVLTISQFPTLALLNDQSILYMANSAHSFAQQSNAADWSYQKASAGNQLSYDQATRQMDMATALHYNDRAADAAGVALSVQNLGLRTGLNALNSIGSGALGGVVAGPGGMAVGGAMGAASAVAGIASAGIDAQQQSDSLAIRNNAAGRSQDIQRSGSQYMRDSNKGMADFAAKGDYQQAVQSIQARTKDAELIPPSLTTNAGGDMMNFVNRQLGFSFRFKFIDPAHVASIGDYWLRWGYAVNRYVSNVPQDMHVMTKFSYWKLTETYLAVAPIPESMKNIIRGMFEKGVTVYRNPADIGTVDMSTNEPIAGITIA